jgi:hypothetical protein
MKRSAYLLAVLVTVVFFAGCQNRLDITDPSGQRSTLLNPIGTADVTVDSAFLYIYVVQPSQMPVNVHRATATWVENGVNWNNFAGAYAPEVIGSFMADGFGWRSVDVTDIVQDWFDGSLPNYGFFLEQGDSSVTTYFSSDDGNVMWHPKLLICVSDNGQQDCFTLQRGTEGNVFDAFVWESYPNDNFGMAMNLYTGIGFSGQKQSLIMFELPAVQELGAIGDFVWYDTDTNGRQDAGEPGISGVTVHLYDCTDVPLAETQTDANGYYLFDELSAGQFYVHFVLPNGYQFTGQDLGGDDALDSDADPANGRTVCTTLDSAEIDLTWDAGMFRVEEEGCTRTKGFWKNHAGFGPQDDVLTPLLPIWLGDPLGEQSMLVDSAQVAYDILSQDVYGEPSNGITKLYAQLLAAKLNIASGASDDDVADAIDAADEFLTSNSWEDWDALGQEQREMVLGWKDSLDSYNNGIIGPGHCDDEDVD